MQLLTIIGIHWDRKHIAAIFQTTTSNELSWLSIFGGKALTHKMLFFITWKCFVNYLPQKYKLFCSKYMFRWLSYRALIKFANQPLETNVQWASCIFTITWQGLVISSLRNGYCIFRKSYVNPAQTVFVCNIKYCRLTYVASPICSPRE